MYGQSAPADEGERYAVGEAKAADEGEKAGRPAWPITCPLREVTERDSGTARQVDQTFLFTTTDETAAP